MRKEDKKKLTLNRRLIVNHLLDLESVLDYLISKQIFTPAIRERIIYESCVPRDRIRQTLDYLITRGPTAYNRFIEALILTGNGDLAHKLDPEYCDSDVVKGIIESETVIINNLTYNGNLVQQTSVNCLMSPPIQLPVQQQTQIQQSTSFVNGHQQPQPQRQRLLSPRNIRIIHEDENEHLVTASTMSPRQSKLNKHVTTPYTPSPPAPQQQQQQQPTLLQQVTPRSALSSTYPITVAACKFSSATNSPQSSTGTVVTASSSTTYIQQQTQFSIGDQNELSSHDDTIAVVSHESLIPHDIDIDWDEINNLDLGFKICKTTHMDRDYTDEVNLKECYQMTRNPRGICLLINNEHFYDNDNNELIGLKRSGTAMDAARLQHLFEELKFDVRHECDLTELEMRSKIIEFVRDLNEDPDKYDASCLIILSHGTDGYIYGTDFENKISIDKDILNRFDDVLVNKPKLFLFQACRGENFNQKVLKTMRAQSYASVEDTINRFNAMRLNRNSITPSSKAKECEKESTTTPIKSVATTPNITINSEVTVSAEPEVKLSRNENDDSEAVSISTTKRSSKISFFDFCDGRPIRTNLPSRSDFFIWYSSVRGFVSHRDDNGSPFIKCVVAVFCRYAHELELVEMIRKVNYLMQQYEKIHFDDRNSVSVHFMMPVTEYHLTKKLYFNP